MKKLKKLLIIGIIPLILSGCFKRDTLEDINIQTTVYPIEYLVERLYGDNSKVLSIYPNEVNIEEYELTKKQKESISESPIFVYNGLTDEKEIARDILNINEELLIIDVSYGLKYNHVPEELWLSPDNYLMLATNIKNSLQEFIVNKIVKEEIDENFGILEEELSLLDAELRSIGKDAKENNTNTIITNDPLLNYLENYDFEVINIFDDEYINEYNEILEDTDTIYLRDDQETPEELLNIIEEKEITTVLIDVMTTLDETQRENNKDYLSITTSFVEVLRTKTKID